MIDLFRKGPVRLALAFTLAVSVTTLSGVGLIYWTVSNSLEERRQAIVANETAATLNQNQARVRDDLQTWLRNGLLLYSVAGLFDADGRPLAGNLTRIPPGLVLDGQVHRLALPRELIDVHPATDVPDEVLIAGKRRSDGTTLVLGRTLSEVSTLRHQVVDLVLFGAAILFLGVTLFTVRQSKRQASRLTRVRNTFARVIEGELNERLPIRGRGDDLDRFAGDANTMLDRLQVLLIEVKDVGDNIAHDLRTPLSVMRARLERTLAAQADLPTLRAAVRNALADLDRTLASITALLRLAEIENGQRRAAFQPIDLAPVCRDAFEFYQPIAEEADIRLLLDVPDTLPMRGDADLLVEALTNLVDNAVKFTPPGGRVTVSARNDGAMLVVSVADTGSGFPPEERQHIGKRFYRADRSRHKPGTGLGLSLVRAIAELHDFVLSVGTNDPCGTVFALSRIHVPEEAGPQDAGGRARRRWRL